MQSSWEILVLLLKVMGTVVGLALGTLGVILLAKDPASRKALTRAREGTLVVIHFLCDITCEYARLLRSACVQYVHSRVRIREPLESRDEEGL